MLATGRSAPPALALTGLLLIAACGGGNSPTEPDLDLSASVSLPAGSTLAFQTFGALGEQRGRVEQVVRDTFDLARARIPLSGITISVRSNVVDAIPEIGMGGRADGGTVRMSIDTNGTTWISSIDTHLAALLAHEMHHVARIRAVSSYGNLLQAMVSEGLADQFSIELTGIAPPMWSVALRGAELEEWATRAKEQWFDSGYDHQAWFFGDASIPRWAGYSIGFRITGDYRAADPSRTAAGLYAEPAASFTAGQ